MGNFIKILRNESLYKTRDEAINALKAKLMELTDGEICVATYGDGWDSTKTVLGVARFNKGEGDSEDKHSYTIYDYSDFKDGLYVNDNGEVSVKVNTDSKDFLSVSENGVSLTKVSSEKVKTTSSIPVSGGPLADLLNKAGIKTIDANTDMQALLTALFTKEIYPQPSLTEGNLLLSIAAPSFTVNGSATNTLAEVNASVAVSECISPQTIPSKNDRTLSQFTYGYSTDGKDTGKKTDTSITRALNVSADTGNYTLTRTGVASTAESVSNAAYGSTKLASGNVTIKEGSNTVNVSVTGAKRTGTAGKIDPVWICSNLGKFSDTHKTAAYAEKAFTPSAPTNSKSITVTGVYPIYATTNSIDTLTKQPLAIQPSTGYELSLVAESNTNKHTFAIPASKTLSTIEFFDTVAKEYEPLDKSKFVQTKDSTLTSGGKTIDYTKYTRNDGTNGALKIRIKF